MSKPNQLFINKRWRSDDRTGNKALVQSIVESISSSEHMYTWQLVFTSILNDILHVLHNPPLHGFTTEDWGDLHEIREFLFQVRPRKLDLTTPYAAEQIISSIFKRVWAYGPNHLLLVTHRWWGKEPKLISMSDILCILAEYSDKSLHEIEEHLQGAENKTAAREI